MKIFTHSADCERSVSIKSSGISEQLTLEVATRFPLAQTPRWQVNLQVTATPCQLWEIGTYIQQESKRIQPAGEAIAA